MVRRRKKITKKRPRPRVRAKKRKKTRKESKETDTDEIKRIRVRVVGIGGGGGSVVSEIAQRVKGASFFAANTDIKALSRLSRKVQKFHFGQALTRGLGTGMDPEIGQEAANSEKERVKKIFQDQDLVILIACLGGGLGSGASPVFARISKNLGNLTYGIFTLPFSFEGEKKMEIAKYSLERLKKDLNAFSIIPNERIFQIIDKTAPLKKALSTINRSLSESLQSLIEIIYKPGLINIDFADLRTIFEGKGKMTYLNSIGIGRDEDKDMIERTINSPLYPYSIDGAKGVLINISGRKDLPLAQVSQISEMISGKAHKGAKIIFGVSKVQRAPQMRVTLLATGIVKRLLIEKPKKKKKIKKVTKPSVKKSKKRVKVKKIKVKAIKSKSRVSSKRSPVPIKKEIDRPNIRKNALQVKKEIENEEAEIISKEKFWETPTFLRRK